MLAHIAEIALFLEFLVPDYSISLLRGIFRELIGGACNGSHGNGGLDFGTLVYTGWSISGPSFRILDSTL
jgi:hypothetical protein